MAESPTIMVHASRLIHQEFGYKCRPQDLEVLQQKKVSASAEGTNVLTMFTTPGEYRRDRSLFIIEENAGEVTLVAGPRVDEGQEASNTWFEDEFRKASYRQEAVNLGVKEELSRAIDKQFGFKFSAEDIEVAARETVRSQEGAPYEMILFRTCKDQRSDQSFFIAEACDGVVTVPHGPRIDEGMEDAKEWFQQICQQKSQASDVPTKRARGEEVVSVQQPSVQIGVQI